MIWWLAALGLFVGLMLWRRRRRSSARSITTDSLLDVLDMAVYRGERWRPRTKRGRWWL